MNVIKFTDIVTVTITDIAYCQNVLDTTEIEKLTFVEEMCYT